MRVLLLTRYGRMGASSRVRAYQYLPYLRAHGLEITVAPLSDDDYLHRLYGGRGRSAAAVMCSYARRLLQLAGSRAYDLVWVEKEFFPYLPEWSVTWLRAMNVPYVVDYDDAVFHGYDRHHRRLVRCLLGRKIDRVMAGAALVIAGNEYLAERARQAGTPRVVQLPSVVDLERYGAVTPPPGDPCIIGWIGSPSTTRYLQQVAPALAQVCGETGAHVQLVGAGDVSLPGVPFETVTWSEKTEVQAVRSFHIGIMPLDDTPWERGKCGYKLIQCMAAGRPVVASPVGINCRIVTNGVNGFLAGGHDQWLHSLGQLCRDPELRQRLGAAARGTVAAEYSLQVAAPRLLEYLHRAARGGESCAG